MRLKIKQNTKQKIIQEQEEKKKGEKINQQLEVHHGGDKNIKNKREIKHKIQNIVENFMNCKYKFIKKLQQLHNSANKIGEYLSIFVINNES